MHTFLYLGGIISYNIIYTILYCILLCYIFIVSYSIVLVCFIMLSRPCMYAVCSDTCMFICTLYILSQHFHSDPRSPKTRRFLAFQHGWPSTLAVMKHLEASDWAQGPSRYALSNIDWDQGVETDGKLMGIDEHIRKRVSLPLKQVWFGANVIILCPFLLIDPDMSVHLQALRKLGALAPRKILSNCPNCDTRMLSTTATFGRSVCQSCRITSEW